MGAVIDLIDSDYLLDSDAHDYYTAQIENVVIDLEKRFYANYDFATADLSSEAVTSLTKLSDTYVHRNMVCMDCESYADSNGTCTINSQVIHEYAQEISNQCPIKRWGSGHHDFQHFD